MTRENLPEFYMWIYKDSHRYWWRLEVWKSGERIDPLDPEIVDWEWSYQLYRDYEEFYHGTIIGQYEILPNPEDFFMDLQNYISWVAIGVSKYATFDPITPIPFPEGEGSTSHRASQRGQKTNDSLNDNHQYLDENKNQEINPPTIVDCGEGSLEVVQKSIKRKNSLKRKTTKTIN